MPKRTGGPEGTKGQRGENATDKKLEEETCSNSDFIGLFVSSKSMQSIHEEQRVKMDEIGNGVFLWTDEYKLSKKGRQLLQWNSE
jgi:hypothetical protein